MPSSKIAFVSALTFARCAAAVVVTVIATTTAQASDPAVAFMNRFAKDTMAAARTRSPATMQTVVSRYADTGPLGLYALGDYRNRLEPGDREPYINGD
jgi:hypothetical protein